MRVIKLTHGAGNGIDKACLMTASNMLIGKGEDGDDNSCVCQVIRNFIIPTNDAIPEGILGELYGPLVWEILGTRTDDRDVMIQRGYVAVRWCFGKVLPGLLDQIGLNRHAEIIRNLKRIENKESANAAANAASRASADASADASDNAAARAARMVRMAARAARAADYEVRMADHAANAAAIAAARAAADAASRAARAGYQVPWESCPDVIREMAAIGDKRPVECVIGEGELCEALGVNE